MVSNKSKDEKQVKDEPTKAEKRRVINNFQKSLRQLESEYPPNSKRVLIFKQLLEDKDSKSTHLSPALLFYSSSFYAAFNLRN